MDVNGGYKLTHDWINGSILWNPFFFFKWFGGPGLLDFFLIKSLPNNKTLRKAG
jgi:hypothetical protein